MLFEYLSKIYKASDQEVSTLVSPILTKAMGFSEKAYFGFHRSFTPMSQETLWHITIRTCPPTIDKEKRATNKILEILPDIKRLPNADISLSRGDSNSDRFCTLTVVLPPDYFRMLIELKGTPDDLKMYDFILEKEQNEIADAQQTWIATNALFAGALHKGVAIDHVVAKQPDGGTQKSALSLILYCRGARLSDDVVTPIKHRIADIIGVKRGVEEQDEAVLLSFIDCSSPGQIDILNPEHAATFLAAVEDQIKRMQMPHELQPTSRTKEMSDRATPDGTRVLSCNPGGIEG